MESADLLDLQFHFNALRMLSVATLKDAMVAFVWLDKVNRDLPANTTGIATTIKFVKMPFVWPVDTLPGYLTIN